MVIGMTWLRSHNPLIDWRTGKIEFTCCTSKCKGEEQAAVNLLETFDKPSSQLNELHHAINSKQNFSTQLAIEDLKNKKVLTLDDIKKGPFSDYLDVFEPSNYQELPPHCQWDHKIDLTPDWESKVWKTHTYPLTYDELQELDKFLEENLKNGRILPSDSPIASPVFFINKKDGKK